MGYDLRAQGPRGRMMDEKLVDDLWGGIDDIHRALANGLGSAKDAETMILRLVDETPQELRQQLLNRLHNSPRVLDRFCARIYEAKHSDA